MHEEKGLQKDLVHNPLLSMPMLEKENREER
jgi:hypothetical protein